MSDSFVGIDEAATIDKRLDAEQRTVGGLAVLLERIRIAGAAVGNYMDVNGSSEGLVHDADVLAALGPLATEATLAALQAQVDVALSTRASEATVATLATEATVGTLATEATVGTLATQATAAAILAALAEVDVDLQALTGAAVRSVQPGLAGSRIDTGPLANRRTAIVKAHPDNTGIIYVGFSAAVTVSTPSAFSSTGGLPLEAGASTDFDLDAGQALHAIASAAADVVAVAEGSRA